jgi:hypothetical protein
VRISLFSKASNPNVDPPLLHKSKSYVDALVANHEAAYIDERRAQLLCWHRPDAEKRELHGVLGDWCLSNFSILPRGEVLAITTRQLKT